MINHLTILDPLAWPNGAGKIVLSFDDGPSELPEVTSRILEVLDKHSVRAAFCMVGIQMKKSPHLVREIHDRDHQIVYHTFHHNFRSLFGYNHLKKELELSRKVIRNATQNPEFETSLFRPPVGVKTPSINKVVHEMGLQYAHLTTFVNDARMQESDSNVLLGKLKKKLKRAGGGSIVFHETCFQANCDPYRYDKSWLPNALDEFVKWAKNEGFIFELYPTQRG